MLVKKDALLEECGDARHILRKTSAHDRPRECVYENVQHEFFALRTVPEEDWRADGKRGISLGLKRRILIQAVVAE